MSSDTAISRASAKRLKFINDRFLAPRSMSLMYVRCMPARSASCSCDMPRLHRRSCTTREMANSKALSEDNFDSTSYPPFPNPEINASAPSFIAVLYSSRLQYPS